jgi:hypothetical protein
MIEWFLHPATLAFGLHLAITVGLTLRVIGSQPPTGVALSWLMLISIFPYFGGLIYLMVGPPGGNRPSTALPVKAI